MVTQFQVCTWKQRQAGAEIQCCTSKKGKEEKEAKKRRNREACEMLDSKRVCSMPVWEIVPRYELRRRSGVKLTLRAY
jgi:hypothetical protein